MNKPRFNESISEEAIEYIEPGQVYVTAPGGEEYRERTSIVEVIEAPDEHPDALVEVLESWEDGREGHQYSTSPYSFIARLYHRE